MAASTQPLSVAFQLGAAASNPPATSEPPSPTAPKKLSARYFPTTTTDRGGVSSLGSAGGAAGSRTHCVSSTT